MHTLRRGQERYQVIQVICERVDQIEIHNWFSTKLLSLTEGVLKSPRRQRIGIALSVALVLWGSFDAFRSNVETLNTNATPV
jgi:hypothetical protein